ncbi:MAG TPA: hypothetical protein PKE47_15455, partial [Verrucomicrobiota bacterium]|nr:hypothetical protein [Verrucomicrobiota bacterium]
CPPPGQGAARPPPAAPRRLRAGPLRVHFGEGDLRHLRLEGREVIRRIYGAVRDRNWDTVPGVLSAPRIEDGGGSFRVTFSSEHRLREVHFVWQAEITGRTEGGIRFVFDGEARSTFLRNRIGLCVLHPIPGCAGVPCRARGVDGAERVLCFPEHVAAEQPVAGLHDLAGLAHEVAPGVWAELSFEGDVFETEDQRNWIDASFKTYSTPLRLPFPVEVPAGTRIRQVVQLRLVGPGMPTTDASAGARAAAGQDGAEAPVEGRPLAEIGLGMASHGGPLTPREIEKLARLGLRHLRADVRLARPDWPAALDAAQDQSRALGVPLELAVHLPAAGGALELAALADGLRRRRGGLARLLVLRAGAKSTPAAALRLARTHLGFTEAPLGAGTDADFYQLNQFRPPQAGADFIHWTMNPQVHAFDLASLRETPAAIPAQLASAREHFPRRPLVVSPVTLRPRFNAVATGPEPPVPPGELPPAVDPRQLSLFGAAWTLAVLKHLSEGGAESATLFETTGWRGVMETEQGSPLPDRFPSSPGQLFPLFHAIGAVNGLGGGEVIVTRSSDPLRVESFALTQKGWACLWLANLTGERQAA